MTNKVLLNNIDHGALRVATQASAEYGDSINQVLVFPTEFQDVQRDYPIFLRRDAEGAWQAIALLGLERDENLFLGPEGWETGYVPAFLQRGPFLIGLRDQEQSGELVREPMIHIDLDHPRVGEEGQPLFLPQGGNSPYLEHVARVLRTIYTGIEISPAMYGAFEAEGLIEPIAVEVALSETEKIILADYHGIGHAALAALDGAALERLHRQGFLAAAFLVAGSLGNVSRLIERKTLRRRQ